MIKQIGPYEVIKELGRGGMGVVYLATDTRLDRQVAIKALPAELASDPARLERFEREAKTLAHLNHPNLAGIHGVEEQGGARYLVLELVEGESLAERLDRGPLPVDEAVEFAIQIASGLEAAHNGGVIHRDLKPANVMVTPDGQAKLLDFGLARTDEIDSSSGVLDSPTMTTPQPQHSPTIEGAILGTAAYMSPEQARGRRVDKRTDTWSFGVLLYEMLVGASPFQGETASDSIGAVLHKDLDLDRLPQGTHPMLRLLLRKCLQRSREQRLQAIGDARVDLEFVLNEPVTAAVGAERRSWLPWGVGAAVAAIVGLGGLLAGGMLTPETPPPEPVHVMLSVGEFDDPTNLGVFKISPSGRELVYTGTEADSESDDAQSWIFVRDLSTGMVTKLKGTEGARSLNISPDGSTIVFTRPDPSERYNEVCRVGLTGGPVTEVFSNRDNEFNITNRNPVWINNDEIVIISDDSFGLYRVPIDGGKPNKILELPRDQGVMFNIPMKMFDDTRLLVHRFGVKEGELHISICVVDLESGDTIPVLANASNPSPLPGSRLLFIRDDTLSVARVDPITFSVTGTVTPIIGSLFDNEFDVSHAGHLIFAADPGTSTSSSNTRTILAVDADRTIEELAEVKLELGISAYVAQDGNRIGVSVLPQGEPPNAYVLYLDTGFVRPVFPEAEISVVEGWAPDGRMVVSEFNSLTYGELFLLDPGSGLPPERIFPEDDGEGQQRNASIENTGRFIVFDYKPNENDRGIGLYAVDLSLPVGERVTIPIVVTEAEEDRPSFSPAGSWLAYETNASGRQQVVLRAFDLDDPGRRERIYPVSFEGGRAPFWSHDGSMLYFTDEQREHVMGVSVTIDPELEIGNPEIILDLKALEVEQGGRVLMVDAMPDGRLMCSITPSGEEMAPEHLNLILNWFTELDQIVPPSR
jgi:eukaryotic-like serine/threonine-protein kinase